MRQADGLLDHLGLERAPAQPEMHRDMRDKGCAIAALNGDVARMSNDTKAHFELGIQRSIDILSDILIKLNKADPGELAGSVLTEMVGALAVSRTLSNSELSAWLLNNTRSSVKKRIGLGI